MMKKNNLDKRNWKPFRLTYLFDVSYGNKFDFNKMIESEKMNVAFVSRSASNNGVKGWVEIRDDIEPYPANCLTVALGGSIGSTFVQPKQFYTGQNVAVLMDKENGRKLSVEEKLYVSMLIKKECDCRYIAFGRELNKHIKKDFTIKLPSNNGEIDWDTFNTISKGILKDVQVISYNRLQSFSDIKNGKNSRCQNYFLQLPKGIFRVGKSILKII